MAFPAIPQSWLFGLVGGLMIGGAAALLLLVNGRIMGASGILGRALEGDGGGQGERLAFLVALIGVPGLVVAWHGGAVTHASTDLPLMAVAGLLVGIGTRMANGCTSGHGVCGMSRFSLRSIAATGIYLVVGMAVYFIARHIVGVL